MSGPDDEMDRPGSPRGGPDEVSPEVRAHSDALDAWIEGTDQAPLEGPAAAMAQVRSELRGAGPAPGEVDDLVASVLGSLDATGDHSQPDDTSGDLPRTGSDRAAPRGLVRSLAAAAAVLVVVALGATALLRPTGEENAGEAATTEDALEEPPAVSQEAPAVSQQEGGGVADTDPDTDVASDPDESAGGPEEQTPEAAPASPGDARSDAFAGTESDARDDASATTSPFAGLRVVLVVRIP